MISSSEEATTSYLASCLTLLGLCFCVLVGVVRRKRGVRGEADRRE
jgi:heme exporter protein D